MSPSAVLIWVIYILISVTSIGMMLDGAPGAPLLETVRCLWLAVYLDQTQFLLKFLFLISSATWAWFSCHNTIRAKKICAD